MKSIKLLIAVSLFALSNYCSLAQDKKNDVIAKLNGESITVNVTTVGEKDISFTYPNETVVNSISKNLVKEIRFGSGRVQAISTKVVISGESDWEKVIVTTLESDITGLVRKGDVKAKSRGNTIFSDQRRVDEQTTVKLKKQAAAMKAHIILLQNEATKGAGYTTATSLKQGVAYGYE